MSKQEEAYNINDELIDQEVQAPVKSNKIKYTIAIITGVVMAAAVAVLLVGHFKFDWFKSETYKIKANIVRAAYQANYFTEKKDIEVKASFSEGQKNDKKLLINSNFVVVLTERKELEKGDFLNTASLVILDSNLKTDEDDIEMTKFSIFDEATVKELEANPNGSKYPIGIFTFHEDGTLGDIKLPDNMDKYNADTIVELIKNVVPKLTRNRTEDMSNGLEIKEKKTNNVKTIIETQAPRTYESFKGSKYSKTVERDIEDDHITNIRVHSSAFFQTEEEENVKDLGLKDFLFNTHSKISSIATKEEKETAELVKKIAEKFNFISSEKLIENILEQERKEKEIPAKITDLEEEGAPLRNLAFSFNFDKTFELKRISFLGQYIAFKYRVAVKDGKAINQLIIDSSLGSARFGNDGVDAEISKSWSGRYKIFTFRFPPLPIIAFSVYAGGSLGFSVKFTTILKTSLQMTLSGSIDASAEISIGSSYFAKIAAGVEGNVITATGYATITNSGISKGYSLSGGRIEAYTEAYIKIPFIGKKTLWSKSITLFNGWSTSG